MRIQTRHIPDLVHTRVKVIVHNKLPLRITSLDVKYKSYLISKIEISFKIKLKEELFDD